MKKKLQLGLPLKDQFQLVSDNFAGNFLGHCILEDGSCEKISFAVIDKFVSQSVLAIQNNASKTSTIYMTSLSVLNRIHSKTKITTTGKL